MINNMLKVGILDYGTGNIASIFKVIKNIGAYPFLVSKEEDIPKCNCIILPGVGHFGEAIKSLKEKSLFNMIANIVETKIPTLGICLGFQLLTLSSEESIKDSGLGILPLKTIRIDPIDKYKYKVPHLGWNSIDSYNKKVYLLKGIHKKDQLFFYSNAYSIRYEKNLELTQASYSHESDWIAIAEYENFYGVQFHPEKSRLQGLKLLKNFISTSKI